MNNKEAARTCALGVKRVKRSTALAPRALRCSAPTHIYAQVISGDGRLASASTAEKECAHS